MCKKLNQKRKKIKKFGVETSVMKKSNKREKTKK